MKKLKLIKKLTLNKQTISNLNAEQTARIIGGDDSFGMCTIGTYNICSDLCWTNAPGCDPFSHTCESAGCTPGETYTCGGGTAGCTATVTCNCPPATTTCPTNGCETSDGCETEYNCESRPGYRVC